MFLSVAINIKVGESTQVDAGPLDNESLAQHVLGLETPILAQANRRTRPTLDLANMLK